MLDGEGRLQLDAFVPDTLLRRDYRRLYEALDYVADHDTLAFARFGVEIGKVREAVRICSAIMWSTATITVPTTTGCRCTPDGVRRIDLAQGYRVLYANLSYNRYDRSRRPYYRFADDTLRIDFGTERPEFALSAPPCCSGNCGVRARGIIPCPLSWRTLPMNF